MFISLFNVFRKAKALFIVIAVICVVLLLFITIGLLQKKNPSVPLGHISPPSVIPKEKIHVLYTFPDSTTDLVPGHKQTFSIIFESQINQSLTQVSLIRKDFVKENATTKIAFTSSLSQDGKTLTIVPSLPVYPYSEYTLSVINPTNGSVVYKANFLSSNPKPTPVKENNLALVPFLPHETNAYRLSYSKSGNVYIFNFKYNPSSPDNLQTQYERAKSDAIRFIQSKGINVSTIVIEWRYS